MNRRGLASVVLALLGLETACASSRPAAEAAPPAQRPPERPLAVGPDLNDLDLRMESTVLPSKRLGAPLRVDVSWLAGTEQLSGLPVVYVTDGHWRRVDHKFVHYLTARKLIPPVLVVGIGYPEGVDVQRTRAKDLVEAPGPFLDAIREEVIPFVERRFRCDPARRVLFGASMGGHFSLYTLGRSALAGEPWFLGYVGASSYLPDSALSLRDLRGREVPAQLYLTYGGRERGSGFGQIGPPNAELFRALDREAPAKLQVMHHVYPDTDHYTNTRPTLVDGVRLVLGTEEGRGIGFTDLSLEDVRYDFRATVQAYDWEPSGALKAVAPAAAPALDGVPGSLRAAADFGSETTGRLHTTFDHFEDLAGDELVVHVFVPPELAELGYEARFFLSSTYQWKEDLGEAVPLDRAGWNRLTYSFQGKKLAGDAALARAVGVALRRPPGAPAWKGDLYFDGISW